MNKHLTKDLFNAALGNLKEGFYSTILYTPEHAVPYNFS